MHIGGNPPPKKFSTVSSFVLSFTAGECILAVILNGMLHAHLELIHIHLKVCYQQYVCKRVCVLKLIADMCWQQNFAATAHCNCTSAPKCLAFTISSLALGFGVHVYVYERSYNLLFLFYSFFSFLSETANNSN